MGPWVRSTCGALGQVKQLWGPGSGQAAVGPWVGVKLRFMCVVCVWGGGGAVQGTKCGAFPPKTKIAEVPKYVCGGGGEGIRTPFNTASQNKSTEISERNVITFKCVTQIPFPSLVGINTASSFCAVGVPIMASRFNLYSDLVITK